MTAFAPLNLLTRRSKSASVENRTKPPDDAYSKNSEIAGSRQSVAKRAFGVGEKVMQQFNEPWRKALVEQKFHPFEALGSPANSAA